MLKLCKLRAGGGWEWAAAKGVPFLYGSCCFPDQLYIYRDVHIARIMVLVIYGKNGSC